MAAAVAEEEVKRMHYVAETRKRKARNGMHPDQECEEQNVSMEVAVAVVTKEEM